MPIRVTCACGKQYNLKDEVAGRKVKCPTCGAAIDVPSREVDELQELAQLLEQQPVHRYDPPSRQPMHATAVPTVQQSGTTPIVLAIIGAAVFIVGTIIAIVCYLLYQAHEAFHSVNAGLAGH